MYFVDHDHPQIVEHRVQPFKMAELLWWRHLNDDQRQKLDGDLEAAFRKGRGTVGIWLKLHGVSMERAVLDLAELFQLVSTGDYQFWCSYLAERDGFGGTRVKQAVDTGGLVLIDKASPAAYWKRKQIQIVWTQAQWQFLWELAAVAPSGRWLDERQFGDSVSWQAVKDRKADLTNCNSFPVTLSDQIIARRRGGHGYRLNLDAGRIHLFRPSGRSHVEEFRVRQ
jgi:hypothetical protein